MNEYEARQAAVEDITAATWKARTERAENEIHRLREQLKFQEGRNEVLEKMFGMVAGLLVKAYGGE